MTQTFTAVLRDGRIEWTGEPPAGLPAGVGVPCEVILAVPSVVPPPADRGRAAAEILQRIADRGTAFADVTDPVAWQREQRRDRPLPGRD